MRQVFEHQGILLQVISNTPTTNTPILLIIPNQIPIPNTKIMISHPPKKFLKNSPTKLTPASPKNKQGEHTLPKVKCVPSFPG
jgi:hypothetical protein